MEKNREQVQYFLQNYTHSLLSPRTEIDNIEIAGEKVPRFINEFWTARQRQASSLHEISYRACFKPQLPRFFIKLLTQEGDTVLDPFSGRGTTPLEAGLLNRNIIANDVNPLSEILCRPRFFIPTLSEIEQRLQEIPLDRKRKAAQDLSMFYHPHTEGEIVSLKEYLEDRKIEKREDHVDSWIRMVATSRLTGHSPGFFSVYTLPPNQAVSPERQKKINQARQQKPDYRNTRTIILKKSKALLRDMTQTLRENLRRIGERGLFTQEDAGELPVPSSSVRLTVTSPPFLDVVQYSSDNWLRCWFNSIETAEVGKKITQSNRLSDWREVMFRVFQELFRVTKSGGWVIFEVGEVRRKTISLDEEVVPLALRTGFSCAGIVINLQEFTKTANIWGVNNNEVGTNTNRMVMLVKE